MDSQRQLTKEEKAELAKRIFSLVDALNRAVEDVTHQGMNCLLIASPLWTAEKIAYVHIDAKVYEHTEFENPSKAQAPLPDPEGKS